MVFYSAERAPILMSKKIAFACTNNVAEYEACIAGMREAYQLGAKKLQIFGDSKLIVNQAKNEWETKDDKLRPYQSLLTSGSIKSVCPSSTKSASGFPGKSSSYH